MRRPPTSLALAGAVLLTVGAGCGKEKWPPLDQRGVAAADAYVRAVFVDRDCDAALRVSEGTDSCESLRREWRKEGFRLVAGSRRVLRPCRSESVLGSGPEKADCVRYKIVARFLSRLEEETGELRQTTWSYSSGPIWLWLKKVDGSWKVVESLFDATRICGIRCPPEERLWRKALAPRGAGG